MSEDFEISICIPAFKRADFLKRLLDSIVQQSFRNFEVIITDDSPGNELEPLIEEYTAKMPIRYYRNKPPVGTPENWNIALDMAKGTWIKIMHDDDWFSDKETLQSYVTAIRNNGKCGFIFSAYNNVELNSLETKPVYSNRLRNRMLKKNPVTLFSRNIIGPPSVVIHKAGTGVRYDKSLKWLVDIDFYIRFLKKTEALYIKRALINVGIGEEQVTKQSFRQPSIEISESFYFLEKTGIQNLKNIMIYDAWWRLIRNLAIKSEKDIVEFGYPGKISPVILSMIKWQKKIPGRILNIGIFSKCIMTIHYIINQNQLISNSKH